MKIFIKSNPLEKSGFYMAIKKVKVTIRSLEDSFKESKKVAREMDKGIFKKRIPQLNFANFDIYIKTFTPERMSLLRTIGLKNPRTISELAKMTKRDLKSVHSDIKLLKTYDLIKLKKTNSGLMPISAYDEIELRINMPITS